MSKIALCLIVKATDREAELLDRCLGGITSNNQVQIQNRGIDTSKTDGIANHVDGVFLTITGENEKCEEVAKKYNAHISHYKWDQNFANARNFSFAQVPAEYKYIIWSDTDDVWVNPFNIHDLVKIMDSDAIDAVIMPYHYAFDDYGNCMVEHLKTRILRNDGCVTWAGAIHEDFSPNRELNAQLNKETYPLHLTDELRLQESAQRNLRISELEVEHNPSDPRTYWNLANTYYLIGRMEDAKKIYLQFLDISDSDEERFLAWFRIAGTYVASGQYNEAIECAFEAMALRPWYPDPYFLLGEIYNVAGKYQHSKEMLEMGFTKKVPDTQSIVWNPMDYTYNPRLIYAKTLIALSKPAEAVVQLKKCLKIRPKDVSIHNIIAKLEPEIAKETLAKSIYDQALKLKDKKEIVALLDTVPADMKYYPPIVHLRNQYAIKETSSGKDVVIYCSFTAQEWNPEVAKTLGVGGSEEAVIQLAKRFQKGGYNVTVYANTPRQQEYNVDGVRWLPFMSWNPKDKQDVTILWRHPRFVDYDINSDKIYVDIHDVIPGNEFTKPRLTKITKVLFKSEVHRKYYPNIPDDKCVVIPHGLDVEEFDSQRDIKRDPYLILNTSSPDRGLKTCMKAIELAHNKLPDDLKTKLKFEQHYGFDVWDSDFSDDSKMLAWKKEAVQQMNKLKAMGIMTPDSGGRVSQTEVTRRYLAAGLLLYPSEFFEIGFISGMKAMLGGCIPLTTDIFAQGEFCKGIKIHSDITYDNWIKDIKSGIDYGVANVEEIADKIVEYIKNVDKYEEMRSEVIAHARNFTWDKTAEAWIKLF